MAHITDAARKSWIESNSELSFSDYLELQKAQGRYWGAVC